MTSPTIEPSAFAATLPHHAVSASVLVTDEDGRILMLHQARPYPGHPAWWQPPAGLADPGETPIATALREVTEETGLHPTTPLRPLAVDYRCAAGGWPPVIDFAFAADPMPARHPVRLSAEHEAFAWRTFEEWLPFLQPEQSAWFVSLWQAHLRGATVVLVDGRDTAAPMPPALRSGG
ncbi:NUDIX hydrolase [Kitasatospora sp. NPDC048407]|uniref:NUDIX hydrolase n=1 Tax=Kitasatospora sp. NPDC048407 TaxID=3364051 RepID=UPI00371A6012